MTTGRRVAAYPVSVTIGALAVCAAWAPFADPDQIGGLAAVALGVLGYSGWQFALALGWVRSGVPGSGEVRVRRVRQQHRLVGRSWLEVVPVVPNARAEAADGGGGGGDHGGGARAGSGRGTAGRTLWVPVHFDPVLLTLTERTVPADALSVDGHRLYPSGRARRTEPPGRLIDNPSRPDPDAPQLAAIAAQPQRRLLLDAQPAVAAPFAALFWVYVAGGGLGAFAGACTIAATAAIWLSAIRGSDPS